MAKGIQDIGDNLGYLYKTLPDGVTILTTEKNTQDGARSMRINGLVNAPLAASRSAVGTITVSSAAGAGAITAINIAAVNQIGANINVVSSTASVVAAQIAAAINAFTPGSGDNYSAQSDGAVVYIFSSPSNGTAANGLTITVSVTDPSIVTVTTAFTNGSSENGVYDSVMGYRYWIDADYGTEGTPGSGTATPTVLTYAQEITEYITNRGFQAGVGTLSLTVATDALSTVDRFCSITQIVTTNQGGAATDSLEYINPTKFIEGDIIFIRSTSASQVLTVKDAANASVTASPNIYLTDENDFIIQRNKVLMLRYTFDNSLGGIFVEMSRSVTGGIASTTVVGINALVAASSIDAGQTYFITDLGDGGTIVTGVSSTAISSTGQMIRRIPINYTSGWRSNLAGVTINNYYRYYQNVYQSVTGAVGTAPDGDTTNWLLIAKTNNTYYQSDIHLVTLNQEVGTGIDAAWPIVKECDGNGNEVVNTLSFFNAIGWNSFDTFLWMPTSTSTCNNNRIYDAYFDVANYDGTIEGNDIDNLSGFFQCLVGVSTTITGNKVTGGALFNGTAILGITNNYINATQIDSGTTALSLSNARLNNCTFTGNTTVTINNSEVVGTTISSNTTLSLGSCNIMGGAISSNTTLSMTSCTGRFSITSNTTTTMTNVTGLNNISNFNSIASNTNVDISDVTGDLFSISTNTAITIVFNVSLINGSISNNNNTVPANKANCRITQVSLCNQAAILLNTWNTEGVIQRGVLSGPYGVIYNVLFDHTVTIAGGTVEGSARTLNQASTTPWFTIDGFHLDNVGINGGGVATGLMTAVPVLLNLSGTGENYESIEVNCNNSNGYAFINAATAISAGVLTVPAYAEHAGIWYFYGCNGQTISNITMSSTVYSNSYKGPRKFVKFSGAGDLDIQPIAVGAAASNDIVSQITPGPIVLAEIYDFVQVVKQASFYTINSSAVVV